jgi:hypothetical protein
MFGYQAMCESGSNCGGAAHLMNHQPAVTPKNTRRLISWITSRQPSPKNVSRTLLPRLPYSIEYSPAKKRPPEPFGVTKLSEKGCAWPHARAQAISALLPIHSMVGPSPPCAHCPGDKGKKVIEDGPSDAPVHALDKDIYNPLSYNGPTNTLMLQLSEDAAQAPF